MMQKLVIAACNMEKVVKLYHEADKAAKVKRDPGPFHSHLPAL